LILFCDVERPLKSRIATAINRFTIRRLVKATASHNMDNERIGVLNHIFAGAYRIRLIGKRIKAANKTVYYLIKYALLIALLYAIFA
jgi:beta-hydroxylase